MPDEIEKLLAEAEQHLANPPIAGEMASTINKRHADAQYALLKAQLLMLQQAREARQ